MVGLIFFKKFLYCYSGFVSSIDIKGIRPSSEFSIINPSETSCDEIRNSKSSTFHVCLISRVNVRRLGTRYVRRGLDNGGNAANNVEMEQIIFNNDVSKNEEVYMIIFYDPVPQRPKNNISRSNSRFSTSSLEPGSRFFIPASNENNEY